MKKRIAMVLTMSIMAATVLTGCGSTQEKDKGQSSTVSPAATTAAEDGGAGYSMEELNKLMEVARMGVTDKGLGVYYAANSDATVAILLIADPDSKETASFVGQCEAVSDETIEITDESTEATFQARVLANEDGTWSMELGDDMGTATMAECKVSEVLDAMDKISQGGIPVL